MSDQCSVCLGEFDEPVCIPCGHVYCIGCITDVVNRQELGRGGIETAAKCPTCRKEFQLVVPDLTYLPKKYHPFVVPPLRRIYLPAPAAATATQEHLREANKRIEKLEHDLLRAKEKIRRGQATEETLLQQCERHQQKARVYRDKELEARQEMRRMDEVCRAWEVRVRVLEGQVSERQDRVEELEAEVEQLEERVEALELRESELEETEKELGEKVEELEERVEELEEQEEELNETVERLEEQIDAYDKQETDGVKREKEARDDERRKARKRMFLLENTVKELKEQNSEWYERSKDLEAETAHLKAEVRRLKEAARLVASESSSPNSRVVKALPKRRRTAGEEVLAPLNQSVVRNFLTPPVVKRPRIGDFCGIDPRDIFAER